jgi:hypothetical protein
MSRFDTHEKDHAVRPVQLLPIVLALTAAAASAQPDGLPELPAPRSTLPTPEEFAAREMRLLDANRDGRVSWREFSARHRGAFNEMDAKRRGYLTAEDLRRAFAAALQKHAQAAGGGS